ncbi:15078_t:CDS:2 [Gigaspora margarita]|uniref:15078_t:CDS:1 n=1 Tax=Gigaspora margarita TaxID=4874 RepID=A0ABN7WH82_GIGMA|nr:15078_t:CDS:2 [Gigaspora margarita]
MSLDNDDDPQYSITFEHDYHGELIIDYELVEVVNNEEQELIESDYMNEDMAKIVENTNTYERVKGREGGCEWKSLTLNELKIWFGLIIYMGIHQINTVEDLWNRDEKKATHEIRKFMNMVSDEKKDEKVSSQVSSKGKRAAHVTKNFELPLTRLLDGDHLVEWKEKREACIYCRYLAQHGDKAVNYNNPPQSNLWCCKCNVPLCSSKMRPYCFRDFYSKNQKA